MPEWIYYNEDLRRIILEGLYLFALQLRETDRRGLDRTSPQLVYGHLIVMCEAAGLRESKIVAQEITLGRGIGRAD